MIHGSNFALCPSIFPTLVVTWHTVFDWAGEILNACYSTIILALRLVQLHPGPEPRGEFSASAESQGAHLFTHKHTQLINRTMALVKHQARNDKTAQIRRWGQWIGKHISQIARQYYTFNMNTPSSPYPVVLGKTAQSHYVSIQDAPRAAPLSESQTCFDASTFIKGSRREK